MHDNLPSVSTQDASGRWVEAIPEPFYWGLIPWIWKRLTGYRDAYGRKAALLKPWEE